MVPTRTASSCFCCQWRCNLGDALSTGSHALQPVLHFRMLRQPVGALLMQSIGLCEQQLHLLLQV